MRQKNYESSEASSRMKQLLRGMLIALHLEFPLHLYRGVRSTYREAYLRLPIRLNIDIDKSARYNLETIDVMKRVLKKDSNCVDVGCHRGAILKEMLRLATDGMHFAFEPLPSLCEELRSRFPNVITSEIALSDTKGEATFYDVVSRRAYSGLKVRNLEQTEEVCEITVQTDLLDNCIPSDVPIHLIKIDVEGAELLVLRGAINTVRRYKPVIVFECGFGGADFYDTSPSDIYDLLVKECGLKISLMKAWLCNKPSLSQKEFTDQYYQRRDYYFMAHT